jgi:hypothetical protein
MPRRIDDATLQMALIGYQAELSRIEQKMAEIRSHLRGRVNPVAAKKAAPKRILSGAARARIAAAQKKRWAAFHKGTKASAAPEAPKAKRISEEGMKRIIAATKKRWAAKRAAAAKAEPVAANNAAAVKSAPAMAAKKVAAKVGVQKAASVTRAAESPAPEVVAQ